MEATLPGDSGWNIVAETPMEAFLKLNLGLFHRGTAGKWRHRGPFRKEETAGVVRRCYDNIIRIKKWAFWIPFEEVSQEHGIPTFPGYKKIQTKLTKLRNVYVDSDVLKKFKEYLHEGDLTSWGSPGFRFKCPRLQFKKHGSCLTSLNILMRGKRKWPPSVVFNIRASEATFQLYSDLMILDEILKYLELEGAEVIIKMDYGFFSQGRVAMLTYFGSDFMEHLDLQLTKNAYERFKRGLEQRLIWKRSRRLNEVFTTWLKFFGRTIEEGILWEHLIPAFDLKIWDWLEGGFDARETGELIRWREDQS